MTTTAELASFARSVTYDDLSLDVRTELKKRLLDTVGIGIAAIGRETTDRVREAVLAAHSGEACTLWGQASPASPVGAATYNTALTRYLDYMDSYLAPGETPHPSDNVGSVLAVAEARDLHGRELLAGLGVAYEVQGELAWNAPVRDRGWDHVTHTVLSAATGAGAVADLEQASLRDAIGIAGTGHNALRVTRTEGINEWKGLASANAARNAVFAVLLAERGVEGPKNLFEGSKGWQQVVSGEFEVDCSAGCERVLDTMTKRYVAETYAQSAVEGVIELAERGNLDADDVEAIHLDTFHGAKLIIGGGEGDRHEVQTRAQADHSLPYMLAAALLDRELTDDSYEPEQIQREAVQRLLGSVVVAEDDALTERFEAGEMPAVVEVELADGSTRRVEKDDFAGHPNRPMDWAQLEAKFHECAAQRYDEERREAIVDCVRTIEDRDVAELLELLD